MQIISTIFFYVIDYQFKFHSFDSIMELSWPKYFSKLPFDNRYIVTVIFIWLYLILSKIECSFFLYFPQILFSYFFLKVWLNLILFFLYLGNGFFLNHILYPHITLRFSYLFDCLIRIFVCLISIYVFWLIFHPSTTFLVVFTDVAIFKKYLCGFSVLRKKQ